MNSLRSYYSLVRYCPDVSRQEFVNVGVAVYDPLTKRVLVRLTRDNRRITQVFGKQDLHFINRLKRSLEENLKCQTFANSEEISSFISRSANAIQLGPIRPLKTVSAAESLQQLYVRLIEEGIARRPPIIRSLNEAFAKNGVEPLIDKSVTIDIPTFEQSIRVPYAYQNGRYNLISPVEFAPDMRNVFSKAGEKAIEGQVLYDTLDPEHGSMKLIVVAKFAAETSLSARSLVSTIFERHHVAMHTFDDMSPLIEHIREAAIDHGRS